MILAGTANLSLASILLIFSITRRVHPLSLSLSSPLLIPTQSASQLTPPCTSQFGDINTPTLPLSLWIHFSLYSMHNTLKPSQPHSLDIGLVGLSCSSEMGDYIGMESCVDLKLDYEAITTVHSASRAMRRARRWEIRREYPPPIPMVGRGMKRYYTSDGRLIIREERIRHTECLRAHRANGRLTLHLVPLNEDDEDDVVSLRNAPLVAELDTEDAHNDNDNDGDGDPDYDIGDGMRTEAVGPEISVVAVGGGVGKCYEYSKGRLTSSSCMFGMPVSAVRPVHI